MEYKNLVIWPVDLDDALQNIMMRLETENWQQAKELLVKYLENSSSQPLLKAAAYNSLGVVYQHLGLHNLALQNYRESENLTTNLGNNLFGGIVQYNLGHMYFAESRWGDAIYHLTKAVNLLHAAEKADLEGMARDLLDDVNAAYEHTGKFLQTYTEKLDASPMERVTKLRQVASIYASNGSINEATNTLQEAVNICEAEGFSDIEGVILNDMAINYKDLGLYDRAETIFQTALEKAVITNNKQLQASILNNSGILSKEKGNFEEAIAKLLEALTIRQDLQENARTGLILYNLASIYHAQGNDRLALEYAKKALDVDKIYNSESVQVDKNLLKEISDTMGEKE